jgi:hypothetical protein
MRVRGFLGSRPGGRSYLGGAQAPLMRNGPYRWKMLSVVEATTGHAVSVGEAALAAPARESPREGVDTGSTKTGAGVATGASEVIRIGGAGSNKPYAVTQARKRVDAVHRSGGNHTGDVITLLPRPRDGSQNPSLPPAGVSLGDCTGNSTSAGVCSREFGKQTSVGRIEVFSRDVTLQGVAPRGDLARRKPLPRKDENPDDRVVVEKRRKRCAGFQRFFHEFRAGI